MPGVRRWFSLVKFSHSIFALPFALQGAWLASGGVPDARVLAWVVVCAVAARTAAMGFNRWLDRDLDAANPRTQGREIPAGKLSANAVLALVVVSGAVFVGGAFALNDLCGQLSPVVLLVLLAYSAFKRFSWVAHGVLGLALGIAPLGAWLAVQGDFDGRWSIVVWLAAAVLTWVAGFDLIYACQDADHDRAAGLHSIPARFGVRRALWVSRGLHVVAVACLVASALVAGTGVIHLVSIGLAAALLAWEQSLVRHDDLSRVDVAFFTLNGWVGVALFVGLAIDLWVYGAPDGVV
jgi:4-hydroxybenzoate polyprenyltransferase